MNIFINNNNPIFNKLKIYLNKNNPPYYNYYLFNKYYSKNNRRKHVY